MKNFDLIEHLFKLQDIGELYLVKSKDTYECRIEQGLDGKKVFTGSASTKRRFLHIRDGGIHGVSNGFFTFDNPADFAVPCNNEFYLDFFEKMMKLDTETFLSYVNSYNLHSMEYPEYASPVLSGDKTFSDYNFKNVTNSRKNKKRQREKHVLAGVERNELVNKLKKLYGDEEYDEILKEVESLFETHKILRIRRFCRLIVHQLKYPLVKIKKFLPLVAFFQRAGPWRRSWIKLNYDPREHFSSYRHQVIILNRKSTEICLIEHPRLIFELEQNKDVNLKECADENGFLTDKGVDLINLYFDKPLILSKSAGKHVQHDNRLAADQADLDTNHEKQRESSEDSDFEIYD
ncbi:RNA polymerase III transcription factor (TF)IIIC subunit [Trachipleistophora hominis]|uniref:RNA polymerase III transcription factor (TF)IIIC subunit n=1 Tax=Trachipleistophora hominis TaxID=72359 RepID=L7JZV2_TRAHO|nr:RNA polymerase III transcription factor (TF)IIIC subunit [Trachipleistophora hominis]